VKSCLSRKKFFVVLVCMALLALLGSVAHGRTITVQADGTGDYPTIQDAIDDSNDGDIIEVQPGTYTGDGNRDIDFKGKAITVRSENGPEVTIIDCENSGRGFYFHNGEDENSIVDGFTITRGVGYNGGGILCDNNSSPIVSNSIFHGNLGTNSGGGLAAFYASPTVKDCTFRENRGGNVGGGATCANSGALITGCIFVGNYCTNFSADGGGMYIPGDPSPTIMNCLFVGNKTARDGGGGGIRAYRSSPTIVNCTFAGNNSDYYGGGVDSSPQCSTTVINSILWGNEARRGGDEMYNGDSTHTAVAHCDIRGGWNGSKVLNRLGSSIINGGGNINANPLFVNGPLGDYYLSQTAAGQSSDSPCVDAGSDLASVFGLDLFTTRTDQIWDAGTVDMGYHYLPPNTNPVACIIGGDRTVEVGSSCEARGTLDGSCSSDADSTPGTNDDIEYFDWYEQIDPCDPNSDIFLGSGEVIECNLPLGEHVIVLEVIDKAGAFDANEVTITVEDTTPPEFSLSVAPDVLWPPNHKMVEITPSWEVSDNCDESLEVTLVSITMNEDDNGKGNGHTSNDIQVDDNGIWLRAERSGRGTGRVYTITYQAADDSGNATVQEATVTVPHNRRKN
jgi:hypothetical protein